MARRKFSWSAFRWAIGVVAALDILATTHLVVPTILFVIVNLPAYCTVGILIPKARPSQFAALAIAIAFVAVSGLVWGWIAGHTFAIYIPEGHCLQCAYSLTNNTSGFCPECGTHFIPDPKEIAAVPNPSPSPVPTPPTHSAADVTITTI